MLSRFPETQARSEHGSYWLSYKCGDVVYANHDLPQKVPYIYECTFEGPCSIVQLLIFLFSSSVQRRTTV